ncbi:HAMP domain-containing sensor histidine kinase [Dactylosporangium fulvum]|uniref:histidine kinase n=1 Tax=Dactylosporangium fulvum TaxID=53359 RepID=A0ABY5VQP9_9ACTN|nr:HAMP domain-containing sensor histidine kinase [Dactylosporangium fulvum]UWP79620.1 HAMP domain-containing histidine kinase [Dactylosporangium fulvum]
MTGSSDTRLLRRATVVIALQVSAAVAATVMLVSVLAFSLTIRAEHRDEERTVRAVTLAAGADLAGTDAVLLLRRDAGGTVRTGPGVPPETRLLDLDRLHPGRGNADVGSRHYEAYVVDRPDGTRTVGLLDVTAREEAGERLVGSLALAGLGGIAAAAVAGAVLGRRAVRPLAQALALQRRFVADASHELRTPLAVLHTRAQLVQRRAARAVPAASPLLAEIDRLTADSRALGEVVEDLLLSAELEHRPAHGAPVDTGELVHDLVESLRPYAAERNVTLTVRMDEVAPVVHGVRSALRRALAALLDNAVAHVGDGGRVEVHAHAADGRILLGVHDNGDGVDPATIGRLMRRFARGTDDTGRPDRRFGLGLALVQEVVEAHGGKLRVAGEPGKGARFTLDLPR